MRTKPSWRHPKVRRTFVAGHDNLLLSETGPSIEMTATASGAQSPFRQFVQATLAEHTRRAYAGDLAHFRQYGGHIPCDVPTLQGYLAYCAQRYAVSTVVRRLAAIRHAHEFVGLRSPTQDPAIALLLRGIRRKNGVAQRQAKPLTRTLLRRIVRSLGADPLACRDRALLLLGFAGAFRRSELVALDVEDLEWNENGLVVRVRRGKTDQEQRGRDVAVPMMSGTLCPVEALKRWLQCAEINSGPLFRRFDVHGNLTAHRLDAGYVSRILKSRLAAIGVEARAYSAHSLRAGLVTEAARAGVPGWKIRQQTGHRSEATLARYIRDGQLFRDNAAGIALRARSWRARRSTSET